MKLSDTVKEKLTATVQAWADENLEGRPALLANAVYASLEEKLLTKQEEIELHFPTKKQG